MTTLSTHILDTASGRPASGVDVVLEARSGGGWAEVARGSTDGDGRIGDLGSDLHSGDHRVRFDTEDYGNEFYPEISIIFRLDGGEEHYHIPLLLSPFGYTTYRGS
jgi:5-hydroxyisourate hydrolase